MQAFFLALLVAPLLSSTDASTATTDTSLTGSTLLAGHEVNNSEAPAWFKRKKRHHVPAYRRLRARRR